MIPTLRSLRSCIALAMLVCPAGTAVRAQATASAVPTAVTSAASIETRVPEAPISLNLTEYTEVRLVLLPTTVEDRRGRVVRGLKEQDFRVFEDRVPQKIEFFSVEGVEPVSIAFLLDISGSMRQVGKLESAKEAIRFFVDSLRLQDRFALVCFADEQVAWITEFTSDRRRFLERLAVQEGFGQTALHDAVAATPALVDERAKGRRAVILLTDGIDNASRLTMAEALSLARRVNVPIYTIGFTSIPSDLRPEPDAGDITQHRILQRISSETGGTLFTVHDPDELKDAILRIDEDLRHQYLIGYYPTRSVADGSYRRVDLQARSGGLTVRTRKGYYARP